MEETEEVLLVVHCFYICRGGAWQHFCRGTPAISKILTRLTFHYFSSLVLPISDLDFVKTI